MDNLFNVENNIYTNLIIPSDYITQNKYFIDINYKNRSRLSCSIDEIVTIKKYAGFLILHIFYWISYCQLALYRNTLIRWVFEF